MNKQDIFPLYVGKCKYRWTYTNKSLKNNEDFSFGVYELYQLFTGNASYDRVQLILKRISDMSEEEIKELTTKLGYGSATVTVKEFLMNGSPATLTLNDVNTIHNYLRENGYALSDEWFTNGIAVEAGK